MQDSFPSRPARFSETWQVLGVIELLVRCLELAYVTNRQEILDNLLRPPVAPTAP